MYGAVMMPGPWSGKTTHGSGTCRSLNKAAIEGYLGVIQGYIVVGCCFGHIPRIRILLSLPLVSFCKP